MLNLKKICKTLIDQKSVEGFNDYLPLANEIVNIHRMHEKMKISEVVDCLEKKKAKVVKMLSLPNRRKI